MDDSCCLWRFDSFFEFGHTYLPEFQQYGVQFSLSYVPQNIMNILRLPSLTENRLDFPRFNGFAFGLHLLETLRDMRPDLVMTPHLDKLLGGDDFRLGRVSAAALCRQARQDCRRFAAISRPYRLYA